MTFKILLIFFIATVCSCKHLSSDLSEIKENPEAHAKRLYAALQYAIISKNKKSFFYQDNENYGFTLVSDDPLGAKFLADISTIEDYAYSDERSKELAKFLFPMLNSEEKEVLFNLVHRGQISSISFGEKFAFYDVIGRYMDWFPSEFIASLISPEKFQNYLRTIQIKPGEVQWDGNTSRHYYSNSDLQHKIKFISKILYYSPLFFHNVFRSLDPVKKSFWSTSNNTINADSRVQPFDLITTEIKHAILDIAYKENPSLVMTSSFLAEYVVQKAMGLPNRANVLPLAVFREGILDPYPNILCADPESFIINGEIQKDHAGRSIQVAQLAVDWLLKNKTIPIQCGNNHYHLQIEDLTAGVTIPKPSNQPKLPNEIQAIATVALVEEMNKGILFGGIAYLASRGYVVSKIENIRDLKADFMAESSKSQFVIPVGHSFDASHTQLGIRGSIKLTVKRKLHGKKITLKVYLPPISKEDGYYNDENQVLLTTNDIASIFCSKKCQKDESFFVLNTSCHSQTTLNSWMYGYYEALKKTSEIGSVPIIFAANRGFSTDNPLQVLSHLDYPLNFIEDLASGLGVDQVKSKLDAQPPAKIARRVMGFLLQAKRDVEEYKENAESFKQGFSPVCNLDDDGYFNGSVGAIRFKIANVKNLNHKVEF